MTFLMITVYPYPSFTQLSDFASRKSIIKKPFEVLAMKFIKFI